MARWAGIACAWGLGGAGEGQSPEQVREQGQSK